MLSAGDELMRKGLLVVIVGAIVMLGAACFAMRVVTVKENASAAASWDASRTARTLVLEAVTKDGRTYDFTQGEAGKIVGGKVRAILPLEGQSVIPKANIAGIDRKTVQTPDGPREVLEVVTNDHEIFSLYPFKELDDRVEGQSRWKTISLPLEDLSSLWVRSTETSPRGWALDAVLTVGVVLAGLTLVMLLAT